MAMRRALVWIIVGAATIGSVVHAQTAKVAEGIAPKWALKAPELPVGDPPTDALIQARYADTQVRVSKSGQATFFAQRFKILRPEALSAANLRFVWRPVSGQLIVHAIRLYRKDGSVSDMLGKVPFQIIQREENIEQAILTGLTTAVFAVPGVDIGDELEFSATITERDPTLGEKSFGALQFPLVEVDGAYRLRLLQSEGVKLNRTTTPDLVSLAVNNNDELLLTLDYPKSANLPQGAPGRFGFRRLIEYSSFDGWADISTTFWKHFDVASKLAPNSAIRVEIAKIAAMTTDPETRALAALKLVQDRTRYVYVGFGTGNYTPATADQTWDRRYGDCKGKTALLLAMLRELGLPAEAVLVNQTGIDGIETRLASPALFNHVLVRATIGGTTHWLDATLFNSPKFAHMPQPIFRAALPLRLNGADLETVTAKPLTSPAQLEIVSIDASAGTDKPARVSIRRVLHGNEVSQMRAGLASLAGEDLKQALRNTLQFSAVAVDAEQSSWAYDDATGALTLNWAGTQKIDWEESGYYGKQLILPGAGFTPPGEFVRPKQQDQSAPWALDFPYFKCWITAVRLPPEQERLRWTYMAKPVRRELGGVEYFRQATLRKGVIQTVMSKRALKAELPALEAKAVATASPSFNNEKSFIYQQRVGPDAGDSDDSRSIVDIAAIDWISAGKICQSQPGNR